MQNLNFKEIFENLDKAVAIVNCDNKIVYANNSFFEAVNVSTSEDLNKFFVNKLVENQETFTIGENNYKITKAKKENYTCVYLDLINDQFEKIYSDFISTVSHELRTPLTSIRGFADTMLMSFDKLDKNQVEKFLTIIKEQSNRLIKLVENLLSISKIQVQQSNLVLKSVNPKLQIEKVIDIVNNQHPKNSFELICEKDIPNILADENKFQQVMINLLDNAAKYSYENGEVKITLKNSKPNEEFVVIKIQDFGIGIEKENQERIFKKFTRIENHLTRKTEGSGLGLYIVKNLVEKMNGKITIESSTQLPNSGTTFEIILPAISYTNQSNKILKDN